jgi:hypothetical protein
VLAPLRPDLQTLAELAELFGAHSRAVRDAGMVAHSFIADYEVVRATARSLEGGEFADLEDLDLRHHLERSVPALLAEHGVAHLDIGELRSAHRSLTQTLAGVLFDEGFAGVVFHSKLTSGRCLGAFVGRVELAEAQSLGVLDSEPVLETFVAPACRTLGLTLAD